MLYKDINDVKDSAGFATLGSKNAKLDLIREDLIAAENELVRKYLGKTEYSNLQTAFDAGLEAGSKYHNLLPYVRRYVTHKALRTAAAKLNVKYTGSGLQTHNSNDSKPAREWMLTQLKNQILESACAHLDALLAFLEENKGVYTDWAASDQYKSNKGHIINSIDVFQKHYYINDSYSTLYALNTAQEYVEDVQIRRMIGSDFYDTIKGEIETNSISSSTKTLLEKHLYRICAFYTVIRSLQTMSVSIENNGIKINEYIANMELTSNQRAADIKEREILIKRLETDCCDLVDQMIAYLNETATDVIFPDWYGSSKYVDPNVESDPVERNNLDSGFYMP